MSVDNFLKTLEDFSPFRVATDALFWISGYIYPRFKSPLLVLFVTCAQWIPQTHLWV